jgi:acetyl esterase/lipase
MSNPPPFDPELAALLATAGDHVPGSMAPGLRAAIARQLAVSDEELRRGGRLTVEERAVPGRAGDPDISLLICTPVTPAEPVGCVYHIHGGGLMIGDNRTGIPEMLDWAEELGLVVVSVEYRLAPQAPHPGPVDDCYAGLLWTAAHAARLGFAPGRLIVAGGSAGGGLAAAVTLMARDLGDPDLLGQMLISPMLDDRNDTFSTHQMAGVGPWDRAPGDTGWTTLLGDARGGTDVSPYAAPTRATDLTSLPATFIDVGSAEAFRDGSVDYANRIWQAGGRAELHVWPGGFHGFDSLAPAAAISRDARAARVRWLRRLIEA